MSLDLEPASRPRLTLREYLSQPTTKGVLIVGALLASALYYGLMIGLGGPIEGDATETVYSTWAAAHGAFACLYPPTSAAHLPSLAVPVVYTAPLYPLLSGLAAFLLRIGAAVPFPTQAQLGPHCQNAVHAMFHWSVSSSAILPTIRLSYLVWPLLVAGAAMLLTSFTREITRWQVLALVAIAVAPTTWMPILDSFHPESLLAMGLNLAAVALVLRRQDVAAGALFALALLTRQTTLLMIIPMVALLDLRRAVRLVTSLVGTFLVASAPLILVAHHAALRAIVYGTSRVTTAAASGTIARGGTWVFALGLHGAADFLVARVMPLLASFLVALAVRRRCGGRVWSPEVLLPLLAVCVGLRLVFEENLFGYYFFALATMLLLADAAAHRLRGKVVVWIGMVTIVFNPVPWGFFSNWTIHGAAIARALPFLFAAGLAVALVVGALRRRIEPFVVVALLLTILVEIPELYGRPWSSPVWPTWAWQVILVTSGMWLAAQPLLSSGRASERTSV